MKWFALVVLVGCASASHVAYRPVASEPGTREASYQDIDVDGHRYGDLKLRALGVDKQEHGPAQVRLDLRLRNSSDAAAIALDFNRTELEVVLHGQEQPVVLKSVQVFGKPEVAPQSAERLTVIYTLPAKVDPEDVDSFELEWTVATASGIANGSSPFVDENPPDSIYAYSPYWYDAWGPFGYWGPSSFYWGWTVAPYHHYLR